LKKENEPLTKANATANVIGDTVSASPAKHDLHPVLCRNRIALAG